MASGETVRLVFVGCGLIARHHLRALQESGYAYSVCGAVDKNLDTAEALVSFLPKVSGCKVFTSLADCLHWGQFDAAIIMLPHHLHEPYTTECLRAGKHVLLEKPLAHTLSSCVKLMRVAEKADAVLMIGEQSAYWPEVVKAKELIESGEIGQPLFAKANYWESACSAFNTTFGTTAEDDWRCDPEKVGGGVLMDGATHWVRPLRTWFGEVKEVVGVVCHPLQQRAGEILASVLLQFSSGITASLYCHRNGIPMHPLPFFQIFGEKGEITIDGDFLGGMSVITTSNPEGKRFDSLGGYNKGFSQQMKEFLRAIDEGKRGVDSCQEALGEVLVAKAVYKSVHTRKWECTTLDNLLDTSSQQLGEAS